MGAEEGHSWAHTCLEGYLWTALPPPWVPAWPARPSLRNSTVPSLSPYPSWELLARPATGPTHLCVGKPRTSMGAESLNVVKHLQDSWQRGGHLGTAERGPILLPVISSS